MNNTLPALASHDIPGDFGDRMTLAKCIATAGHMVPREYQDNPGAVMVAMSWALQLGISLAAAMAHVQSIGGKPGLSTALMTALVHRAGHRVDTVHADGAKVTLRLTRSDGAEHEVTYSYAEAQQAGIAGSDQWMRHRIDMLWARCASRLYRRHAGEVLAGMAYTPEELQEGRKSVPEQDADDVTDQDAGCGCDPYELIEAGGCPGHDTTTTAEDDDETP